MRRLLPFVLGLAGLGFLVSQSGAATAPAPSCAGISATDKAGDQVSDPVGLGVTGSKGPDNLDITQFWFDRQNGKTTINIQVKKLSKANTTNATSISWYATWTTDAAHFVDATSDGSAVTFEYGDYDDSSGLYTPTASTSGQFFEGDNGVVSIVIPNAVGGNVGAKITQPYVTATENYNTPAVGLLSNDDRAPDSSSAYGKGWTVTDCPASGTTGPSGPTGATPTPTATGTPTATPTPGGGGGGGGGQVIQAGKLNVKAGTALGSAAKAAKSKKAAVKLTGNATKITAQLYTGSFTKPKVYGKGAIAKVAGKATLKLKLSKKVKKGSYALTLIGTNPDGAKASKSFKVKFKK